MSHSKFESKSILTQDLHFILENGETQFKQLKNSRIFLTGGTGFFGRWLQESFAFINKKLNLNANLTVLTRNPQSFIQKVPHLANNPYITLHQGDITNFTAPNGSFTHIIHAATPASADLNANNPLLMAKVIIDGSLSVLEFAKTTCCERVLMASSGAVYGNQPLTLAGFPESYWDNVNPNQFKSAYSLGKWTVEKLCSMLKESLPFNLITARGFAFVGPFLPLDIHFAIGNFIKNRLETNPIIIGGNPNTYRSYLYAADLTLWLWILLLKGKNQEAYNVGSDKSVSIGELATLIGDGFSPTIPVKLAETATPNGPENRYIPDIQKIKTDLGLIPQFDLKESIRRTLLFHQEKGSLHHD